MSSFDPKLRSGSPIPIDRPLADVAPDATPGAPREPQTTRLRAVDTGSVGADSFGRAADGAGGIARLSLRPAPGQPTPPTKPLLGRGTDSADPDPRKVDEAVKQVRARLDESGVFGDVSHAELREVTSILGALNAAETRAVYDRLSPSEKATWGREINSGAPFGAGGLDAREKRELLDTLAGRLTGTQLADLSRVLGEHDDVVAVGQAVARLGSPKTKVGLVRALAPAAETGDRMHLETHLGLSKATAEDPQAIAIAEVLSSLRGNSASLGDAVSALSGSQLDAVMASAARGSVTTTAMAGSPSTSADYDPELLARVLDAGATSRDPAVKARLLQAASRQLEAIQEAGGLMMPYVDRRNDARQVADAMTRLLRSDTNGIMRQLETQGDRDGGSLVAYTTEMVRQGRTQELGEIILDLQLGNDHKGNAIDRFEATAAGTTGKPYHRNAEALGYFVGAIQVGIAKHVSSFRDQAAVLKSVFGVVAGLVGLTGTPGKVVGTLANGLAGVVVDEVCRSVAAGGKDLRSALRELAYPRDAAGRLYEGPAEESYDSTVGRVIDAHGG